MKTLFGEMAKFCGWLKQRRLENRTEFMWAGEPRARRFGAGDDMLGETCLEYVYNDMVDAEARADLYVSWQEIQQTIGLSYTTFNTLKEWSTMPRRLKSMLCYASGLSPTVTS